MEESTLASPGPSQPRHVDTFSVEDSDEDKEAGEDNKEAEAAIGAGSGRVREREAGLRGSREEGLVITLDSDSEDETPASPSLLLPLKKRARQEDI